jgi:CBS domain-containing protein
MQVQEVMTTSLVTVMAETSAQAAAALLAAHGFAVLPVVDERHRLIGLLSATESDGRGVDGNGGAGPGGLSGVSAWLTVGEVMSAPRVCISPDDTVIEAATRMIDHRVDRVPVIDGDRLVGIITRSDLMHRVKAYPHEVAAEVRRRAVDHGVVDGFEVSVSAGLVTISGRFAATDGQVIASLAKAVPGVTEVRLRPWPAREDA